ncbi:ABC-2 transporter permease [Staphylococcus haemolyticus]|uniref:ABC-2 transporter permease n=1 Tax=Staphylococcus haemolyticus TaxID=1283 RepID=UPI00069D9454|nr:ABC-2 transporter permease [Staphylococcus haemolyticus]MBC3104450.1 ABC-2 transporter permease [Staphylococcus haemolyticus]MCT1687333.1 ABC-2 transporter permease [Staphylococcus haemolyticus]MCT1755795.1 ABC-2 transporter permease [Staphylococcus haemolyticus]MEB6745989.1 ABC-2 transporter permease [Staphylococcus haemolyticus]
MKGLTLSSFYASKKSLITYLIVAIVASFLFAFINPAMACFLPMIFLLSPVTDNLKREKDSKWMYYISTLPTHRSAYIKSYFAFYGILIFIGLIIGLIAVLAIHQNLMLTLISGLVGIGAAGTYAIMFPLTFKFGPENSNVIMISTSVIVLILFFITYFGVIMSAIVRSGSFSDLGTNPTDIFFISLYAILGLICLVASYFISIAIFNKQEL